MANMTLAIPEELYKEMQLHSEIKWSEIARQAFQFKIVELHWMDKLVEKSELTDKDIDEIGHKVKGEILKRLDKLSAKKGN